MQVLQFNPVPLGVVESTRLHAPPGAVKKVLFITGTLLNNNLQLH